MNHLLTIRRMDVGDIEAILELAKAYKATVESNGTVVSGPKRTIGLLFFENSTRTRVSFEQAASLLGHKCVSFSGSASSMKKGETLKDTILTLRYEKLEALVMRHEASGSCNLAAKYFQGPVVNAGDGRHEHPTQALADALTIMERKGPIKGLKIAIVGDVTNSRVARSNAWLLSKLGADVRFIGPRTLVPSLTSKLPVKVYHDLRTGLHDVDIVMALRLQRERMDNGTVSVGEFRRMYQINRSALRGAAPDALVMHPGPLNRGIEIDDLTADGPNSAINEQVTNGIYVRMAALTWTLGESLQKTGSLQ